MARHDFPYIPYIDDTAEQLSRDAQEQLGAIARNPGPVLQLEARHREAIAKIPDADRALLVADDCLDATGLPTAHGIAVFGSCAHLVGLFPGRPVRSPSAPSG